MPGREPGPPTSRAAASPSSDPRRPPRVDGHLPRYVAAQRYFNVPPPLHQAAHDHQCSVSLTVSRCPKRCPRSALKWRTRRDLREPSLFAVDGSLWLRLFDGAQVARSILLRATGLSPPGSPRRSVRNVLDDRPAASSRGAGASSAPNQVSRLRFNAMFGGRAVTWFVVVGAAACVLAASCTGKPAAAVSSSSTKGSTTKPTPSSEPAHSSATPTPRGVLGCSIRSTSKPGDPT